MHVWIDREVLHGKLLPSRPSCGLASGRTSSACHERQCQTGSQWWENTKGALHRVKCPFCSRLAPRAGLEPATSRLQVPQFFNRAWTISSPAYRKSRGGCRALVRRYWIGSSASSLCTFLPTALPFGRLRSGLPFRLGCESGQASLNSPEVSTTVSRGGCSKE